jgi:hypothetical protein
MFGIDWLRAGVPVYKHASVLTSKTEAIADAQTRARDVAKLRPGQEPDSFRLTGPSGEILGVFPIDSSNGVRLPLTRVPPIRVRS